MLRRDRSLLATACLLLLACAVALGAAPVGAESTPADDPNVTVVAHYPTDDGYQNETVVTPDDVAAVGAISEQNGLYRVPITLTEKGGTSFASTLVESGFTSDGVSGCRWQQTEADAGYCLLTVVDGEVTFAASLSPGLASSMESGDFEDDPRFVLAAESKAKAETIAEQLEAGGDDGENNTTGSGDDSATTTDGENPRAENTATDSAGSTPGFTAVGVVLALLGTLLVARR
ncbi:hypothetical protein [Haloarchaeobius amylolyticus]|uniref:hypothetical protein n=1 Tax=Haloarchaeobius amylolyticus TaxID=1198296 RepID=UPI00226EEC46|nr:hypothetical protein [Haloarchaeobius amylolyticus]